MSVKSNLKKIVCELRENSEEVKEEQTQQLIQLICDSNQIFLFGKGRSGVAIQGFANRLMHLGLSAYVIGEISTPHSKPGDLLIIGSGSGETEALISVAEKAKKSGVKLALITMNRNSTLGKIADTIVEIPGDSKGTTKAKRSVQPMGSLFEQTSFLLYDAVVLQLMEILKQDSEKMYQRHADLE